LRIATGATMLAVPFAHAVLFARASLGDAAIVVNALWSTLGALTLGGPWLYRATALRSTAADSGGNATSSLRGG